MAHEYRNGTPIGSKAHQIVVADMDAQRRAYDDSHTYSAAVKAAKAAAKRTGEFRFVVYEDGYHVASEFDLDTWFAGIARDNILDCYDSSGERS